MKELIKSYGLFKKAIERVMGGVDVDDCAIYIEPLVMWELNGTELILDGDYYYTVSSLGSKGEELYLGVEEDFFFVMAYEEDQRWDTASVFVLSLNNQILKD